MSTLDVHYEEIENLIIESLYVFNKNKNFFKDEKKMDLFYECSLVYCNLKLERFKNFVENYKKEVVFPKILKESLSQKQYKILQEGVWDSVKDFASSAYEKVKGWASDAVEYAKKSPLDFAQTIGDIISLIDPTGIVDLINGSVYLAREEYLSAFFCGVAALFVLPGFIASLSGVGAVAGIPMIVAGKTLKGILKFGGKITEPLIKLAIKILESGKVVSKLLEIGSRIPGLGKFLEFFKNIIPKFLKAAKEGGSVEKILQKVFGTANNIIKAPGMAAEKLVAKGTALTGEKAAAKITPHIAKSKLGKAAQLGGAALFASHLTGKEDEKSEETAPEENKPTEEMSGDELEVAIMGMA